MNYCPNDLVAIDTNVFGQIGNHSMNTGHHINTLLEHLIRQKTHLLVDKNGKIAGEYKHHLNNPDFLKKCVGNEPYLMEYWMDVNIRKKVPVVRDSLWNAIHGCIPELNEENDRIFVYVAFISGKVLISNDNKHIGKRKEQLHRATNALCSTGGDVMTSYTAYKQIREE